MPLARIRTYDSQEAAPVSEQLDSLLAAHGYTVEVDVPSATTTPEPDLEISVERCSAAEALVRATLRAEAIGGDVLLAAGALPSPAAESVVAEPAVEELVIEDASAAPELLQAPPIVAAVSEPQQLDVSVASSLTPSMNGLTSSLPLGSPSDVPVVQDHEPTLGPIAEAASNLNAALASSLSEASHIFTSGLRQLRGQLERGSSRAGQALGSAEQRVARSARSSVAELNRRLAERRAAIQQRRARAAAALEMKARPAPAERAQALPPAAATIATARQAARPAPGTVTYARRLPRRRAALDYWRGAFTAASALAVLVMVVWAVANSRPVAIPNEGSAVGQQVPFGPVTLSPQRSATQSRSATPALPRRVVPAAAAAPAARTSAVRPKPQATRRRRMTRSAAGNVAEDEVVVRHYGRTANGQVANAAAVPNPALSKGGPKRISDE